MSRQGMEVILVHGTRLIGNRTRWTEAESAIHRAIDKVAPEADIVNHEWGGANTHSARIRGAQRLAEHLKHTERDVAIIAHSHGGNVARSALAIEGGSEYRRSLMTLGTPFISLRNRSTDLSTTPIATITLLSLAATAVAIFLPDLSAWRLVAVITAFLAAVIVILWGYSLSSLSKLGLSRDETVRAIDPQSAMAPVTVVATTSDEAGLVLSLGEALGFVSGFGNRVATSAVSGIGRLLARVPDAIPKALPIVASAFVIHAIWSVKEYGLPIASEGAIDPDRAVFQFVVFPLLFLMAFVSIMFSDDESLEALTSPDLFTAWNEFGYEEVFGNIFTSAVTIGIVLAIVVVVTTVMIGAQFATTGFDAISLAPHTRVGMSPITSGAVATAIVHPDGASSLRHSALTEDPEVLKLVTAFLEDESGTTTK